jgi:hypothetical protein
MDEKLVLPKTKICTITGENFIILLMLVTPLLRIFKNSAHLINKSNLMYYISTCTLE